MIMVGIPVLAQAVYVLSNHFSKILEGYHSPLQCCQSNQVCLCVIGTTLMGASICISAHKKCIINEVHNTTQI